MAVEFFIDIEDSAGNKLGSGPITSATRWRSTSLMDRSGTFSFSMPLADPQAAIAQKKHVAVCHAITDGGPVELGRGIIDECERVPQADGNVMLSVSGDDILRELTYRSVRFLELESSGNAVTHSSAVSSIASYAPSGWTLTADGSPPNDEIYYQFGGETVLAAALKVADLSRTHFYRSADRTLTFTSSFTDSGIRAIEAPRNPDTSDPHTCYIVGQPRFVEDTRDLITRIYPYGSGSTDDAIDMSQSYRTSAAAGYTLDLINNYINNDAAEAIYGRIEEVKQYRDIAPLGVTIPDQEAAANALHDIAFVELQRRSVAAEFFGLRLAGCASVLRPMQSIPCVFRRVVDGRTIMNVDDVLNIIGATVEVDISGLRTSSLTVATVDRWPDQNTDAIVELSRNRNFR